MCRYRAFSTRAKRSVSSDLADVVTLKLIVCPPDFAPRHRVLELAHQSHAQAQQARVRAHGRGSRSPACPSSPPNRISFLAARTLKRHRSCAGNSIALVNRLKSGPRETAGGKGPEVHPEHGSRRRTAVAMHSSCRAPMRYTFRTAASTATWAASSRSWANPSPSAPQTWLWACTRTCLGC